MGGTRMAQATGFAVWFYLALGRTICRAVQPAQRGSNALQLEQGGLRKRQHHQPRQQFMDGFSMAPVCLRSFHAE